MWRCDEVGRGVTVHGRPAIDNSGTIAIGSGVVLEATPLPVRLGAGPFGSLLIRDGVHVAHGTSLFAQGLIVVGEGSRIGALCIFDDSDEVGPREWGGTSRPIVIGRNVIIGNGVTLLPGSFVGDGARIASGAVVSGVVQPRSLAGGAPAEVACEKVAVRDVAEHVLEIASRVLDFAGKLSLGQEQRRMSGWTAAGALRLVHALEQEFDVRVPGDEFMEATTIADLVAVVRRALAETASERSGGIEDAALH